MKKFFIMLEDLQVAITFAESGEYHAFAASLNQYQYKQAECLQTV